MSKNHLTSDENCVIIVTQQVTNHRIGYKQKGEKVIREENSDEGCGCRMYRMPGEIRQDMEAVNARINEIHASLNVRNLLGEMLELSMKMSAERCISELEDIVGEAKKMIDELGELRDLLLELGEELEETKWELGM